MLILLYKSLFLTNYPIYMKNMFTLRSTIYNLRGNYILTLPVRKTTTYGRSFFYHAANQWNSLPDFLRTLYSPFRFIRHLSHENFCGEVLTFNFKQLKLAGYVSVMILCLSPWSEKIRVRELT